MSPSLNQLLFIQINIKGENIQEYDVWFQEVTRIELSASTNQHVTGMPQHILYEIPEIAPKRFVLQPLNLSHLFPPLLLHNMQITLSYIFIQAGNNLKKS